VAAERIRVLLVEDSQPEAQLLTLELAAVPDARFSVRREPRLSAALSALADQVFDVALLDLTLPDSFGLDTFHRLHRAQPSLPIVVLTGLDDQSLAIQAVHAGAQDYLPKSEARGPLLARAMRYAIERQALLHELRAQTERLRNSEAGFRIVATNADGLAVIDEAGIVRFANPAVAEMFGQPLDALIGQPLEDPPPPGTTTERVTLTSAGRRDIEVRTVALEWEGAPACLASLRDITEKRALEEQLVQAQKMEVLGRMAGGIAHDFNNVLTGIRGHIELAQLSTPPEDPLSEHLRAAGDAADRAAKLIRQLLAFSRRREVEPELIDPARVVAELERMLQRLLGERIELTVEASAPVDPVRADRAQLEQVVMNLAVNAADAIEGEGTVVVRSQPAWLETPLVHRLGVVPPGSYVRLDVIDDGHGMDGATLRQIFDPFYTTKAPGKGTGLGLSTVYGIVERWHGHLTVDSTPGRGTRFSVFLPAQRGRRTTTSERIPAVFDLVSGRGERLLVVDDDPVVRALLVRTLGDAGYAVREARHGRDALALLDADPTPIDLLVSDLAMPELDGPGLFRALRARQPELAAIFISGHAEEAHAHAEEALGGNPVIAKPFSLAELTRRVRERLDDG
jgi:two-component system cell cycle sensor histidine kinase/response regulator CckA